MPDEPAFPMQSLEIRSAGLRLACWRSDGAGAPLVFVHGFPDTHEVWEPVVTRLARRYRCVVYDVRGAGASEAPADRSGYRISALVSDLVAVLDTQFPDEPVHLVAHDWGSVQAWDAVVRESSDPRLRGRIASYTTISGPCLQHVDAYVGAARHGDWRLRRDAVRQLRRSWYAYAFQVPMLPELFLGKFGARLMRRIDRDRRLFADTVSSDAVHGLELYRANAFHREAVPGGAHTSLPVLLVVPLHDPFITVSLTRNVERFATDLTRLEVDSGHWVMQSHPDELASSIDGFVSAHLGTAGQGAAPP